MKHIHLDSCDSTQDYLKEQLTLSAEDDELLVTCETQTQGHGRNQNKWDPLPNSLYMSFILQSHPQVTWTAIELSVILSDYFLEKFGEELKLKWPNDIYDSAGKKCCGILIQQSSGKHIAGIGINLLSSNEWGGIFHRIPTNISKREWCADIYQYIQQRRINDSLIVKDKFLKRCAHLNKFVTITEGEEKHSGIFSGLGDWGEAILKEGSEIHSVYNGSLRW